MALGASARDVLRLVMARGVKLIAVGALAGVVGALIFSRLLASLLFGVRTYDPATFGLVSAVLVTVAIAACYIPARRATRVDPMIALRYE